MTAKPDFMPSGFPGPKCKNPNCCSQGDQMTAKSDEEVAREIIDNNFREGYGEDYQSDILTRNRAKIWIEAALKAVREECAVIAEKAHNCPCCCSEERRVPNGDCEFNQAGIEIAAAIRAGGKA